jgi:hypothetical protein
MQKRLAYTRDSVLYKKPPHPYECIFRSNLPLIPIANQPPILIEIRQLFRCLCRLVVEIYKRGATKIATQNRIDFIGQS